MDWMDNKNEKQRLTQWSQNILWCLILMWLKLKMIC